MTALLPPPATAVRGRHAAPDTGTADRKFRPDIEGLRAIAVLLVVLYHAGVPGLSGGYVGVDVFFVISGYLITTHLLPGLLAGRGIGLGTFYARRIRRLLPLASMVVVTTVVVTWWLLSALQARQVGIDALWAAVFAVNIHLALTGVDYQANQDPSPLQHFWSLAVEEQFYLFWPLLLLAVVTLAVRTRRIPARTAAFGLIVVIVLGSLGYSVYLTAAEPTYAYFLTTTRAWELGVGALVAIAAPWLARIGPLQSAPVAGTGLAMIALAAVWFTEATPFPGAAALLPVVGTAVVIVAGLARTHRVESLLFDRSPVQALGRLSYGWYLWHWPVLILGEMYLQRSLRLPEALALVAIALWMAMCSSIAVETPLRTYPALVASTARSLRFGLVLVLISALTGACAAYVAPRLMGLGAQAATVTAPADVLSAVVAGQATTALPANLTPDLLEAADDKPDLNAADGISCMVGLLTADLSSEPGGSCVAGGTEDGDTTVVLAGDSHAYHWIPALREIAVDRGWRLVSLTKSGCSLYDVTMVNTQLKREYTECTEWRTKVFERIEQEKPALVITSGAIFSEREGDFAQRWVEGVGSTVGRLTAAGVPTVVLEDIPYPRKDVPKCVAQNPTDIAESCGLTVSEAMSDPERRAGTATAAAAAGATVVDPQPWFCGPERCPVVVGQYLLYSDNSHMTATYSRALVPLLAAQLPSP
ncbi:acyltransferase [Nakamurella flava]|uniref:Acyltransferase n=1 Tax=Nakamurella flava TaxID=2576308 RepID=A0A4U6QCM5_9ACTN|nr:acyltransferase family protein [Nakamurella flava]TKV57669.1 acyltransferase [Nakamurella flava]